MQGRRHAVPGHQCLCPPSIECSFSARTTAYPARDTTCPAQQCVLRLRIYGRRRKRRSSQRAVGRRQAGSSTGDCRSRVLAGGETAAVASCVCVLNLFACLVQEWLRNNPCPDPGIAIRARPSLSPGSSEVTRCKNSRCLSFAPGAVLSNQSHPVLLLQSGSRASSRGGSRPPSCPRSPQLLSPPQSPPLDGIRSPPRSRSPAVSSAQGSTPEVSLDTTDHVRASVTRHCRKHFSCCVNSYHLVRC